MNGEEIFEKVADLMADVFDLDDFVVVNATSADLMAIRRSNMWHRRPMSSTRPMPAT
jgi:hypothetical protein